MVRDVRNTEDAVTTARQAQKRRVSEVQVTHQRQRKGGLACFKGLSSHLTRKMEGRKA